MCPGLTSVQINTYHMGKIYRERFWGGCLRISWWKGTEVCSIVSLLSQLTRIAAKCTEFVSKSIILNVNCVLQYVVQTLSSFEKSITIMPYVQSALCNHSCRLHAISKYYTISPSSCTTGLPDYNVSLNIISLSHQKLYWSSSRLLHLCNIHVIASVVLQ